MVAFQNQLYVVEPNHGQVLRVQRDGDVFSLLDVSASEGHIVPTAITERDGEFILGNLNIFPIAPNSARILTLSHRSAAAIPFLACRMTLE